MIWRIFSYSGQYKKYLIFAALCITAESLFELLIPLLMADIVDIGVAAGDRQYIFRQGAWMLVCAGLALLLGIGSAKFSALAGQGLGANLREAEYAKFQQFSFGNVDHFQISSLVTRMTSDVTNIQNSISGGLRPACRGPVMLVAATAVAFSINVRLAVVFLVALPTLGICLYLIIKNVRPLYAKMQGAIDLVNRIIQENLTAVRVVKAYVRGEYEIRKFGEVNTNLQTQSERAFKLAMTNMAAMQFVMYGTIISILWFGGGMIRVGTMQVGELTGFLSYVLQILNSLMMISNIFLMLTRSLASGRRIIEVLDEEVDIKEDKARDIRVTRGEIEFRHVYFKYKEEAAEYVLILGGNLSTAKVTVRDRAGNVQTVMFGDIDGEWTQKVVISCPESAEGTLQVTFSAVATSKQDTTSYPAGTSLKNDAAIMLYGCYAQKEA